MPPIPLHSILFLYLPLLKPRQTLLHLPQQHPLPLLATPASPNRVARDRAPLPHAQPERLLHRAVVREHVAPLARRSGVGVRRRDAEVRRVVAVDAEAHARVEVGADGEVGDFGDTAQREV